MTLWKVEGGLATDSGTGGPETWFYLTSGPLVLPDVHKQIFMRGSTNGRNWYRIDSITLVLDLPDEWHKEDSSVPKVLAEAMR